MAMSLKRPSKPDFLDQLRADSDDEVLTPKKWNDTARWLFKGYPLPIPKDMIVEEDE